MGDAGDSGPGTYDLPSHGGQEGTMSRLGRRAGEFHAAIRDGRAVGWIDNERLFYLWPAGWRVRFTATSTYLVDPHGELVAREGDWLETAGGLATDALVARTLRDRPAQPCWSIGRIDRVGTRSKRPM